MNRSRPSVAILPDEECLSPVRHARRSASERGGVLPLALLLLVAMGFVATAAVTMSSTDLRISSSYTASNNALTVAEAALEHGMAELTARAQAGEDPDSLQILSDSLGRFAYTVTVYSKREQSGPGSRDLNHDGDQSDVVRYDRSFGYADASASGAPGDQGTPVKLLVAVATDGRSRAQVQAEVAKDRLRALLGGPISLNSASNAVLNGSFDVDGRLYAKNGTLVASGTLTPAYGSGAESKTAAKNDCMYWKAGVKIPAESVLQLSGSMRSVGHVAFDHGSYQNYDAGDSLASFKFTPEELLGAQPGSLDGYRKSTSDVPDFMHLSGINYITSGSVPSQISGSGILIIHNPNYDPRKSDCTHFPSTCIPGYSSNPANQPMTLRINGNGTFNGIIITDQLIRLNGNFNMLGGLASLTTEDADIPANGSGSLKWSCEAVQDAVDEASAYAIRLWWQQRMD